MNIVFDTNVYRRRAGRLSHIHIVERARQLRECESAKGIRALASPVVMLELLAHVADESDPHCGTCVRAVSLLVLHCEHRHEKRCLEMVATCEMEILKMLCDDKAVLRFEEEVQALRLICQQLADVYLSTGDVTTARNACGPDNLALIACQVQRREEEYKASWDVTMSHLGLNGTSIDPSPVDNEYRNKLRNLLNSEKVIELFAMGWVLRAERQANRTLTDAQVQNQARRIAKHFRVPLSIHQNLCVCSLGQGFRIDNETKSRLNTIWDMDIAAIAGIGKVIDDLPIVLVTEDTAIIEACKKAGCGETVMSPEEYLAKVDVRFAVVGTRR